MLAPIAGVVVQPGWCRDLGTTMDVNLSQEWQHNYSLVSDGGQL